jgi:Kef-type K+ transport system membrane component KefB
MPVWGLTSHPLGLGLWNHLPLALGLETLIALTGTYLWLRDSKRTFPRRLTLGLLMGLVTAMTVVGPWLQTSPPKPFQVAISSLTVIFLLFGAGISIDRKSVGL